MPKVRHLRIGIVALVPLTQRLLFVVLIIPLAQQAILLRAAARHLAAQQAVASLAVAAVVAALGVGSIDYMSLKPGGQAER